MKRRSLWGEFSERPDEATREKQVEVDQEIMMDKRGKNDRQGNLQVSSFREKFLIF